MCHINLRGSNDLALPRARTNLYGIDTIRFVGRKLWQTLPRNQRVPITRDFLKEISKLSELLTAAVNCVEILLRI